MPDVVTQNATQRDRIQQVYYNLCTFAAIMNMQINYRQRNELNDTFKAFRLNMIELYYLVRLIKELEGNQVLEQVNIWRRANCFNVRDIGFYMDSLTLFDEFSTVLAKKAVI